MEGIMFGVKADNIGVAAVQGGFVAAIVGDRLVLAAAGWPGAPVTSKSYPLPCAPGDVVAVSTASVSIVTRAGDVWMALGDEPMLRRAYNVLDLARDLKP
jgi:hypothetical protein